MYCNIYMYMLFSHPLGRFTHGRAKEKPMALITCIECGKQISSMAKACPHCGCPILNSLLHAAGLEKNNDVPESSRENLLAADKTQDLSSEQTPRVFEKKPNGKIVCPECGKELSAKAKACPQCGCPVAKEDAQQQDAPQQKNVPSEKEEQLFKDSLLSAQEPKEKTAPVRPRAARGEGKGHQALGVISIVLLVLSAVVAVVFAILREHVLRAVSLSVMLSVLALGIVTAVAYWIGHKKLALSPAAAKADPQTEAKVILPAAQKKEAEKHSTTAKVIRPRKNNEEADDSARRADK